MPHKILIDKTSKSYTQKDKNNSPKNAELKEDKDRFKKTMSEQNGIIKKIKKT